MRRQSVPAARIAFLVSAGRRASEEDRAPSATATDMIETLRPAFEALGDWRVVDRPESRLLYAAAWAVEAGARPIHLAIGAPHECYLTPTVRTILFPIWDYPDIPDRPFGHKTQYDWTRACRYADLIVAPCRSTALAFQRAGVRCPISVVPIPVEPDWFTLPLWEPGQTATIFCRHVVLGAESARELLVARSSTRRTARKALAVYYHRHLQHRLSHETLARFARLRSGLRHWWESPAPALALPRVSESPLTLRGLVYTTRLISGDRRQDARDLLAAFLLAFRDRDDVTLVVALEPGRERDDRGLEHLQALYRGLGLTHRCRVVVIADGLDAARVRELIRATTYAVEISRAEAMGLALRRALAAGRPAVAPDHTAMADVMDESVGLVLRSDPEPTSWPFDPERRITTMWNRIVWSDLRDRLIESAVVALHHPARYRAWAEAARQRMTEQACAEAAQARLREVLERFEEAG
jgi:glycosyltransferase involved in cell wall biosynthesis